MMSDPWRSCIRVRARITDPPAESTLDVGRTPSAARPGPGKARSPASRSPHRQRRLASAQLQPPTGPYHWQDWSYTWDAADVGRHTLRARATDAAGNVQPEVPPWNRLGYGNNAIEVIFVDIR